MGNTSLESNLMRISVLFFKPIKMNLGPSYSLLVNISLISEVTLEFEVYSTDSSSPISKKMSGGMGAQASQLSQLQYLSGRAQSTI